MSSGVPKADLEFRQQMTRKFGARAFDLLEPHYRCVSCGEPTTGTHLISVGSVAYENFTGMIEQAIGVSRRFMGMPQGSDPCARCGSRGAIAFVDYHAYHSGADKDLVVRCSPPAGLLRRIGHELLWWSPANGYESTRQLTPQEEATLRADAMLRAAAVELEISGAESAFPAVERALAEVPCSPALMAFVPGVLRTGKASLAGAIVQARLAAQPDDADAHFWMAEIVIRVVTHGAWPIERLSEADDHLRRALALRGSFPEAETAQCNLLRLRGDDTAARHCFLNLVSKYPDRAEPHFNLGTMVFESNPEQALDHFVRGEALAPGDADYPLRRARALIRLGRHADAAQALARAEELNPDHPLIAEVRDTLRGA